MATSTESLSGIARQDEARDRMQGSVDDFSRAASDTVDRWSDSAQDMLNEVSDDASDYASRLGASGDRFMEDARDYIAAHPLRNLGIAAAAGFVIGRLLR